MNQDYPVTITMLKNLLRDYYAARECCIWRDALGVHIVRRPLGHTYVGEIRWCRYKGEK